MTHAHSMSLGILSSVLLCALAACRPQPKVQIPAARGRVDAPYELQSSQDLKDTRIHYNALPPNAAGRSLARKSLAQEYSRRIDLELSRNQPLLAFASFRDLLTLWTAEEFEAPSTELSRFTSQAQALRKRFSRSGGTKQAVAALASLVLMDPARASEYQNEIAEVLVYSDELAMAQHGEDAKRAYPIRILEFTVELLPTRDLVDKLIDLYLQRQRLVGAAVVKGRIRLNTQLLRLHGPALITTTRSTIRLLAQSGRVHEIASVIAPLTGLGDDAQLRGKLKAATSGTSSEAWLALADSFADRPEDYHAALGFLKEAIERYPEDPKPYLRAGAIVRELNNTPWAIRYYERALALRANDLSASQALAELYEEHVHLLAQGERPNAALQKLNVFKAFHAEASKRFSQPLEPDLASAYAAMASGLLSLGEIESARSYLGRSLKLRKNLTALELLGLIALKQGRLPEAREHFATALALTGDTFGDKFDRNRLHRLDGEALQQMQDSANAEKQFRMARTSWLSLLEDYEMSADTRASVLMELGKLNFHLGDASTGTEIFYSAMEAHSSESSRLADLVAFLLTHDAYEASQDFFLDALSNEAISQYYKTYMSLWVLAEAKRSKKQPYPQAMQFLETLEGDLWSAQLAKYILGKSDRNSLETLATTRGRRAELMYYSAVLGPEQAVPEQARILLEEVLRGQMVLFFEYDMAKRHLRGL